MSSFVTIELGGDDGSGGGEGRDGEILTAYRSEPTGEIRGALILIHEIWGLVEHIRQVADRYAAQGYLVIAPDLLSGVGITPDAGLELMALMSEPDEEKRLAAQPRLRESFAPAYAPEYGEWATAALGRVVDYLVEQPGVQGRIGVLGFCFGGTYGFALAAADTRVRVAVPFYGQAPEADRIAGIHCPVLAFYGGQDERLMTALPEVEREMAAAGVDFTATVYPDAGHAFFNDTGSRYDADAAADSWARSTEFLARALAG
ncbi:dienelactone hydrolase family protein [Compostimonas suwonensis]|uniref:Carboxymethylenebutenolidase n=1 Tax=Compostimonas suwonensis TaxID=1048394 RepID=A0A2M9BCV4_9MICO|nr:dienelactone hydrolase family protein [Compostimonas suwonensis]PJJ55775.1 carboxymethylenebutenolidase [Compostimonas suwonensis]